MTYLFSTVDTMDLSYFQMSQAVCRREYQIVIGTTQIQRKQDLAHISNPKSTLWRSEAERQAPSSWQRKHSSTPKHQLGQHTCSHWREMANENTLHAPTTVLSDTRNVSGTAARKIHHDLSGDRSVWKDITTAVIGARVSRDQELPFRAQVWCL